MGLGFFQNGTSELSLQSVEHAEGVNNVNESPLALWKPSFCSFSKKSRFPIARFGSRLHCLQNIIDDLRCQRL